MPKAAARSESADSPAPTNKRSKKAKTPDPSPTPSATASGAGNDEEDGSEYEIEAILDAKYGVYPGGKIGYFVKWKGYPDDENSWVNEVDAENAGDLVSEYWRNNPHKKKDRGKHTSAKRGRKSVTTAENSDGDSASVAKKRGRKSTKRLTDDEDKDDDVPPHKKAKNASASANDKKQLKKKKEHTPVPSEPDVEMIGDMSKYMDIENWEELVTSIDTIERNEDNTLTVYFTLNSGERVKEDSRICRQRLAQKLISFYENNLRWKTAEELADN